MNLIESSKSLAEVAKSNKNSKISSRSLQIIGQKNMNPTVASLILSLESCISVLAGWIILRQQLSTKEILGCVIMFAAIILAQLPQKQTE